MRHFTSSSCVCCFVGQVDAEVSLQTTKPRVHAKEPTSVRVRFVKQHVPVLALSPPPPSLPLAPAAPPAGVSSAVPPAAEMPPPATTEALGSNVAAINLGAESQPTSSSPSSDLLGTSKEGEDDQDGLSISYVAPSAGDILNAGNNDNEKKDSKGKDNADNGNNGSTNDNNGNNDPFGMTKELPEVPKKKEKEEKEEEEEEEEPEITGPPVKKTLFVLRHGESKWNDAQVCVCARAKILSLESVVLFFRILAYVYLSLNFRLEVYSCNFLCSLKRFPEIISSAHVTNWTAFHIWSTILHNCIFSLISLITLSFLYLCTTTILFRLRAT